MEFYVVNYGKNQNGGVRGETSGFSSAERSAQIAKIEIKN